MEGEMSRYIESGKKDKAISRNRVDLKTLPVWFQYLISLTVIAIVSFTAWIVGHNKPNPTWITNYLIPILGWLYIVLFTYVIGSRIVRRVRNKLKPENNKD
jgi:hypothetical protein